MNPIFAKKVILFRKDQPALHYTHITKLLVKPNKNLVIHGEIDLDGFCKNVEDEFISVSLEAMFVEFYDAKV